MKLPTIDKNDGFFMYSDVPEVIDLQSDDQLHDEEFTVLTRSAGIDSAGIIMPCPYTGATI